MNIYSLKTHFETVVYPAPLYTQISAEQSWAYFKTIVRTRLIGGDCENLGFSVSIAAHRNNKAIQYDENLFQVYFGWLIDADKQQPWRTAEIDFYYRYDMTPELRNVLGAVEKQDIEVAYCRSEDEESIRSKMDAVIMFVDEQHTVWDSIRELKPNTASFQFWLQ